MGLSLLNKSIPSFSFKSRFRASKEGKERMRFEPPSFFRSDGAN